jgi:MFS family permease
MISRNFRLYLAGSALSAIGSAMTTVALSFAVLDAGLTASALGLVLAAQTVPTVLFLLAGGVAGDRWPRRRIMIASDIMRCCAQTALAVLLITGFPSLAAIALLSALIGVGNAFFGPASRGWLPALVEAPDLPRANGALMTGNAMAMIAGPSIAGLIVMAAGPAWALGIDGLSYAISAICLALVRLGADSQPAPPQATRPLFADLRQGFSAFTQRRWVWMIVGQSGLVNMLAIAVFRVVAPDVLAARPDGARDWGFLLGAVGAGALAGAASTMRWTFPRPLLAMQAAICILTAPLLLLAAGAPFLLVLAGSVALGLGYASVNVLMVSAIQREVPKELLSRVMSFVQLADIGLAPIGYALAGPAASWLGPRGALAGSAVGVLASVVLALRTRDIGAFKKKSDLLF